MQSSVFEPSTYHDPSQRGFFALLTRTPGHLRQRSYRLSQMTEVLDRVATNQDVWISQGEFACPRRRVVDLLRIKLLFVDLDTYKAENFVGYCPERQLRQLLLFCDDVGLPRPSLVVYSGRGLQAKWLLDRPLPRAALPRWNACQKHLIQRLRPLGSDPVARDASRVLRLVGTVNRKSGQKVRLIHVTEENGAPKHYGFEYLAEYLLPLSREDVAAAKQPRRQRRHRCRQFDCCQLAWHRLEDLRRLAKIRGGVRKGERMLHLFWNLNFLLLSGATSPAQMFHEAAALARELDPSWGYNSKELSTLYHKARAYVNGETVEFAGRQYPPLYTPKNDTLIQIFKITDDEQRQLRTIVSNDIAAERHRERERERRRAAGAKPKVVLSADEAAERHRERERERRRAAGAKPRASEEMRVTARLMAEKGMSIRQIARELGIAKSTISDWLSSKSSSK